MNHGIPIGISLLISGAGVAYLGYRIEKSQEHPEGTTGFEGPGLNRRGLIMLLGSTLMIVGLILAMIMAPMMFIAAR